MPIKRVFTDKTERDNLVAIEETAGNILYREENHGDGDSLIFITSAEQEALKTPAEKEKEEYRKLSIATLTPDKVDAYIDSNVTDMAAAKEVLKLLAKGLIRVARQAGM